MKKTKATALLLACVMTLSSIPCNVMADDTASGSDIAVSADDAVSSSAAELEPMAADGWVSGWTGAADQAKSIVFTPGENSIGIKTLEEGLGKFQSAEDSFAYYVYELPVKADFTLTAKLNVKAFNSLNPANNPSQASVGIGLFDDRYSKAAADEANGIVKMSYTNNVLLSLRLKNNSASTATMMPNYRYNGKRTVDENDALVENLPTSTLNGEIGPFDVKIQKSGDMVNVSVDGNEKAFNTAELATNPAIPFLSDTMFVGFYIARDAEILAEDIKLTYETRTVNGLSLQKMPDKTVYTVGDERDLTGIEVLASYDDGTTGLIEDYIVDGFDTSTKGEKVMTLTKGEFSVEVPYTVVGTQCLSLKVNTAPVYSDYYIAQRFNLTGFEAEAAYSNGNNATLTADDCEFYIDGKKIDAGYYFTKDDVGRHTVTVKHAPTDTIDASAGEGSFNITVSDYTLSGITVGSVPAIRSYAPNDKLDTAGLTIRAVFTNSSGESKYALLSDDEYEVIPGDMSVPGEVNIAVRYLADTSLTTSFTVTVTEKKPVAFQIRHYPRTTYQVGESFTDEDMKAYIMYSNDSTELTKEYTVDLSSFDNSVPGITTVRIVPNNTSFAPIELSVTVTEKKARVWKSVAFGASATPSANPITETKGADGSVESVNVRSWNGAGKITADQDGMAYYYTRVNAENNFTISADILVNDYLEFDNDDTKRNGQEAFGIMARDVIPLEPDPDKLEGGDDPTMTVKTEKALLDENGEPIPKEYKTNFSSNMVILGGYSGTSWPTDPTALSYNKNANINRINLVMRSGVHTTENSSYNNIQKTGPFALSDTFPKRGNKYHVTLTKINGGIYGKCYDYTTGKETENYQYAADDIELQNLFVNQNEDTIYVGFFASRWADITVSDFELHETDPATDPITNNSQDELTVPAIKLQSTAYSTTTDYSLSLRVTNRLGGLVTIQQNGSVVYRDEPISKNFVVPIDLAPNSVNNFTVLYKPSAADTVTSTDDILLKFTITHKDLPDDYDVLYCSPDGSVNGDGTRENPLDIYSATGFVGIGKEAVALEGTYKMTQPLSIPLTNTGVPMAWKTLRADDGATVTLDFQNKYEGATVDGYYWLIKGIDFTHTGDNLKPFLLAGNHCIIEDCKFYDNGDTGFQISRNNSDNNTIDTWPEYNVVRDCESYNNCDPSKINADGFGLKLTVGYGNIFQRCISHNNLDDGYDAYTKIGDGAIGPVTLESCVSYDNGNKLNPDGTTSYNGGGNNGFKMGGESIAVQHYMKDCIAFENNANGITTNSNTALKLRNFICYKNGGTGFRLYTNTDNARRNFNFDLKGCVSYKNASTDVVEAYDLDTYLKQNDSIAAALLPTFTAEQLAKYVSPDKIYASSDIPVDTTNRAAIADYVASHDSIPSALAPYLTNEEQLAKYVDKSVVKLDGGKWPIGLNHSDTLVSSPSNYWNGVNSNGDTVTDDFFKSVDKNVSLTNGRYSQNADGEFILGDFLARTDAYVHEAGDSVVYPAGPDDMEVSESSTDTTETTTKAPSPSGGGSSSGGGSGSSRSGGGGGSSVKASGVAASTTVSEDEEATERTTAAQAKSFVTPSGVVITPPINTGVRVNFTDIASRAWAVDSINKLASAGIVNGVSANTFAPDAYSKRADFIVMLVKTLGLTDAGTDNFTDVESGKYYANALAIAKEAGIASGYSDGTFKPENTITRQDMMVLVAKALEFTGAELDTSTAVLNGYSDAAQVADYAKPYVAALLNAGIANGTDTGIAPTALITRAQMSVLVANVYDTVLEAAEAYAAEQEAAEAETEETTEADEAEEDTTASDTEDTTEELTEETTEAVTEAE